MFFFFKDIDNLETYSTDFAHLAIKHLATSAVLSTSCGDDLYHAVNVVRCTVSRLLQPSVGKNCLMEGIKLANSTSMSAFNS